MMNTKEENSDSEQLGLDDRLAQLNLRILAPLALYAKERHGAAALDKIKKDSGLEDFKLDGRSDWGSLEQVEAFLAGVRALAGSEKEFLFASSYKIKQSYGPMAFLLRASSPVSVWRYAAKTMHSISSISRYEIVEATSNSALVRYVSQRPESRLMCLSRQAQGAAFATLWGLPPAHLTERACTAHGDDACVYDINCYQHRRNLPPIIGMLLGALGASAAVFFGILSYESAALAAVLGGAIGLSWELKRTNKANIEIGHELDEAVRTIANDDAEARREILALTQRQEQWTRLMEQRVSERTAVLDGLARRMRSLQSAQQVSLRGFSHDMRNPLSALRMSTEYLKDVLESDDLEIRDVIQEQEEAIVRMEKMLTELIEIADPDTQLIQFTPASLEIENISEQLRKRLKALVHGKDIRVSVIRTREAPESLLFDPMVFNRIVDNLMTNAVKYTERGSIVVELSGRPNVLTIKISDTGRGIEEDRIARIFHPKTSRKTGEPKDGYGVGLSVVVQLLAQIGGKLEVMSIENKGTTFWMHLPLQMKERRVESMIPIMSFGEKREQIINDVVTVRAQSKTGNVH